MDLKTLHDKVDKLDSRLDGIDRTLVLNTAHLAEHMKRTDLLEQDLRPVKAHVVFIKNAALVISSLVGGIVSAALAAKSLGLF